MSYEGYIEALCENGHLREQDIYDITLSSNPMEWLCNACGAKFVWWNDVDTTNGKAAVSDLFENQARLEKIFEGNEDEPYPIYKIPPLGVGFHRPPYLSSTETGRTSYLNEVKSNVPRSAECGGYVVSRHVVSIVGTTSGGIETRDSWAHDFGPFPPEWEELLQKHERGELTITDVRIDESGELPPGVTVLPMSFAGSMLKEDE